MEKILIAGAGAMGTIIGALMSQQGHDVTLLDTHTDHVDALNQQGANITGNLKLSAAVTAITPDQLTGQFDLVISTVKQTALQASLKQLLSFMHAESCVLTLQNGLPEQVASSIVGAPRVIGGGMEFSGTFVKPGVVKLASSIDTLGITVGEVDGKASDRLKQVQSLLVSVGDCHITTNLRQTRFTKLTDNCVCSAVPTALGCLLGDALDNPIALSCIAELGRECSKVMQALEINPIELFGFLPTPEHIDFSNPAGKQAVCEYWRKTYQSYRGQTASMLQDLQQNRLCEVGFINGAMLKEANELGLKMPVNERVIACIKRLQSQPENLPRAWNNLAYLDKATSYSAPI